MKIILATTNANKISEIQDLLPHWTIQSAREIIGNFTIEENGITFAQNAFIKASAIYKALGVQETNTIVLAEDSGLSVAALNNEPDIYSARYAGENATDIQNNNKLIKQLQNKGLSHSKAYYTAAICCIVNNNSFVTHGWCHGIIQTLPKGNNGFGYDPLFVPDGYEKTFGELDKNIKQILSHRSKAMHLMKIVLESVF